MVDSRATDQASGESVMNSELQELKDDNERLRKTLGVLHTHSLKLREQRDILLEQRDELVDVCAAIARSIRDEQRAAKSVNSSPGQFNGAARNLANSEY